MRDFVHKHTLAARILAAFLVMYGIISELGAYGEGSLIGRDMARAGMVPLAVGIALTYACTLKEL